MKLYFVTNEYMDKKSGVKKKIDDQVHAFKKFSFDTEIITDDHKKILKKNMNIAKKIPYNKNQVYFFRSVSIFMPFYMKKIKNLSEHNFLILELPTPLKSVGKEFEKDNLLKFYVKKLLFNYSFPRVLKYFDLILEYSTDFDKYTKNHNERILNINNGINIEKIPVKDKNDSDDINLISVANNSKWHGYDRVLHGLAKYYKDKPKKKVYYHCVGDGPELSNLKSLAEQLKLEKYVIFYGEKIGEELDKIFDYSDLALGSLASHRKFILKTSALKNREYCARGIPFIIICDDDDFPKSFKYVHRIPLDDSPVDVSEIIEFYEKIRNDDYIGEMRKYAQENLTWEKKLDPVVKKIKNSNFFNKTN